MAELEKFLIWGRRRWGAEDRTAVRVSLGTPFLILAGDFHATSSRGCAPVLSYALLQMCGRCSRGALSPDTPEVIQVIPDENHFSPHDGFFSTKTEEISTENQGCQCRVVISCRDQLAPEVDHGLK